MWTIRHNGHLICFTRGGLPECDEYVRMLLRRDGFKGDAARPTLVKYECGARSRHLTGDLYACFTAEGKQLHVGTLEECDMSLDDCARSAMVYDGGYEAIWEEQNEQTQTL